MAKSLRSHRERRLRAFKRIRYGKKELERLKKILGVNDNTPTDIVMTEAEGKVSAEDKNVIEFGFDDVKTKPNAGGPSRKRKAPEDPDAMEVENEKEADKEVAQAVKRKGVYPKWMNQRQIRHIKHYLKKKQNRERRRAKRQRK